MWILIAAAGSSVVGCESSSGTGSAPSKNVSIGAGDFYRPGNADQGIRTAPEAANPAMPGRAVVGETASRPPGPVAPAQPLRQGATVTSQEQATGGLTGLTVLTGPPTGIVSEGAKPMGGGVLVDSLVGQINGKPIYAGKFLAEIDKTLAAELEKAKQTNRPKEEWQMSATAIISRQLDRQIQDELLLAEARAALSPEERQGLLFFVNRLRENIASGFGGSEIVADEELKKEGLSLEGKLAKEQQDALVQNMVNRYVRPRVNPAFKDVQRVYERNYLQYNPAPVAAFRMICVSADAKREADVGVVTAALASGTPFADVAMSEVNAFSRSDGGKILDKLLIKPYAEMRLFDDPALTDAAKRLSPGATTGPFDYRLSGVSVKAWMHLESITQKPGRSLEEVQLEILADLQKERFESEIVRFFKRLRDRASVTNELEMKTTLVLIASDRYLIPAGLAKPR